MLVYLCIQTKDPRAAWFIQTAVPSNKQEAHGPHHSPEKQFQSINTFMQSYDYTITLIKREKKSHSPF